MTPSPRTAFSRRTAFSPRKRLTLAGTATALAAAALLTAGCGPNTASGGSGGSGSGSGSGSSGSGSAQAAAGSGSSAPTAAPSSGGATPAPAGNSGATAPPAAAAAGGAGSGTPGTAKSDCTGEDLEVTVGSGEGAAGSSVVPVVFTNKSDGPCGIQGFPGVSLGNSGGQIGAPATRDSSQSSALLTLPAGGKASAQLKVADAQNYSSGTCKPGTSSFLKVYPPNLTDSVDVPFKTSGCQNKSVKLLQIQPVVRGAGG